MKMKKVLYGVIVLLLLGVAYYAISPLFNTVEVNDVLETDTAVSKMFDVVGTPGHPASGSVRIVQSEEGEIIRFENFETINGPQLHLYLSKDKDGKEFIDLGPIKGTKGNIHYQVPEGVDISEYPYVLHWCVPFSVLFNYADTSQ